MTEITEFQTVYYINKDAKEKEKEKKREQNPKENTQNNGFDTKDGEYITAVKDHICYRFEIKKIVGKGSFGQVFQCHDHKTGDIVAVKVLRNEKRLHKQGLIEAGILKSLNVKDPDDKQGIIRIIDSFMFRKHLVLTFEMLSINLYDFLRRNNFEGVSESLVRRFAI